MVGQNLVHGLCPRLSCVAFHSQVRTELALLLFTPKSHLDLFKRPLARGLDERNSREGVRNKKGKEHE